MNKILVAKISKPQGIRGEVKLIPLTDSPEVILGLKCVYISGAKYRVVSARTSGGLFVVLDGIADRNAAELLRGKEVFADKNDLALPEGRWFLSDIIGSKILLNNGDFVGLLTDVTTRGSTDIFTAEKNGKTIMFPFLKDALVRVDTDNKEIIFNKKRFDEVALYED